MFKSKKINIMKTNPGKYLLLNSGNYFICKNDFYFYMNPQGDHLDKYEMEYKKLHGSNKWAEIKDLVGKSRLKQIVDGSDMDQKATSIIETKLIPLKERLALKKAKQASQSPQKTKTILRSLEDLRQLGKVG